LRVTESFEHPQGGKYIRASDHKGVIDFKMSRVEKGQIVVKHPVLASDVEKTFVARNDFTKEAV
jgi:hypothetical protein